MEAVKEKKEVEKIEKKFEVGGFEMTRTEKVKANGTTQHAISTSEYDRYMEYRGIAKTVLKEIEQAKSDLIVAAREVLVEDIEANPSLTRRSFQFGRTGESLELTPWRQVNAGGFSEGEAREKKDQFGRVTLVSKQSIPALSVKKNETAQKMVDRVEKAVAKLAEKEKARKAVEDKMINKALAS